MIKENIVQILKIIPKDVTVVAATKARGIPDIQEAWQAGIFIMGENYIQEAKDKIEFIGKKVKWHLIGHLQKNKAKLAINLFDMIETLDSLELAKVLNQQCQKINKIMPVLIEVNSAREENKQGVLPEELLDLVKEVKPLEHLKLMGLMTMGPVLNDYKLIRPYFRLTKQLFDQIKLTYPQDKDFIYLSMGMSDSYKIAIEEGANIVRIGSAIFGNREKK